MYIASTSAFQQVKNSVICLTDPCLLLIADIYVGQNFGTNTSFDIKQIHTGLAMAGADGLAGIELPLQTEGLVLKVPEEVTRQRRTSVGDAVSSACPPTTALCT